MNPKNLSAQNKTHKKILNHLSKKKIFKLFKEFSASLNVKDSLAVAVSGGPDSLALAYLTKCYSLINNIKVEYFIVDHKLRKESSLEAQKVKDVLKKVNINCKILVWNGKKPLRNISSAAREKRFSLLANECKKNNIETLLAENTMRADTLVNLDQEASEKVLKIMNFMDDLDDVQEVHTNAEFPEDFTEEE